METFRKNLVRGMKWMLALAMVMVLPAASRAQVVDCTGADPNAFSSINAAVATAGPRSAIMVTGPCTEDIRLEGKTDLFIGAWYGQRVTLNGNISVSDSHGVYFYGLDISSLGTNGIFAGSTQAIILDSCTSNGNSGWGLLLGGASEALIISPAAFDNNVAGGISVSENSTVEMTSWGGQPIEIKNNRGPGVFSSQGNFNTYGHTTIANNTAGPGSLSGFGIDLRGGARAQFGAISGPNVVQGNQSGGVSLQENAEISFWNGGQPTIIQGNGSAGVSAGFGSQVTFFNDVEVTGHSGPGLDLYANSQAYLFGGNNIHNNGNSGDPRSAGIRVDGNSQVLLRGGSVTQNGGPGILVLVNSSADSTGATVQGNSGGVITCDSSSWMVSDLAKSNFSTPDVSCRVPHSLGNRAVWKAQPATPDWGAVKALQAKYMAIAKHK
jgi:hypothetical protein